MISCLLLSAGASSRFGSPKALVKVQGQALIVHQIEMLLSAGIEGIVVVLGANADEIRPALPAHQKIQVVRNDQYLRGQTSSVKVGLSQVPAGSGAMVLPVDVPFVRAETVTALTEHFLKNKPLILIPTCNGRNGHPPVFSAKLRREIAQLDDSRGLNEINHRHLTETEFLPVDDKGVLATFNTPEEFSRLLTDFKIT